MSANKAATYIVSLAGGESRLTLLAALLNDWNLGLHLPADGSQAPARLEVYCASRGEAEARRRFLRSLPPGFPGARVRRPTLRRVKSEDWAEAWKRHFRVRHVSRRIVIRPPWDAYAPAPGERVLVLEPGLSFGTGEHGTTRACLQFLDEVQRARPDTSVLDLGCGTGILAIAAAKLGCPRVMALDNDPNAVRTARANAAANGVAGRIQLRRADIRTWRPARAYGLVLANLLSEILVENAGRVAGAVAAGAAGRLVLSGILDSQYAAVKKAYRRHGFREVRALSLNGWTTGCFRRTRALGTGRPIARRSCG